MWRSPANEISLISGVVGATSAGEIASCAGELSSGGFADVAPERHNTPSDPEMSHRTSIAPCTRRMSEGMTAMAAGLSAAKNAVGREQRLKTTLDRSAFSDAIQGGWL
jgi:hypothetical protein